MQISNFVTICFVQISFLFACNTKSIKEAGDKFSNYIVLDTLVKDIPLEKQDMQFVKLKQSIEHQLMIPTLTNGFHGLQVRVWIGYSRYNIEDMVILSETSNGYLVKFIRYKLSYDSIMNCSVDILGIDSTKRPKSSWKELFYKLSNLGVQSLPDYNKISDYIVGADADGVTVEIGTDTLYRLYSYPDLRHNKKKSPYAQSMSKIIDLIEEEFSYKFVSGEYFKK